LTGPLVVWLLHGVALWVWHLPALYQAALGNAAIHAFEHSCFVATACSFAPRVWYPLYATRSPAAGLDALEDQRLAGLLMWIPFGVIFMLLALGLFAAWLGESERKAKPASWIPLFLLAALLAPVAAGCESSERRYAEEITRGRADAGKQAIQRYGCGSCHRIPGVSGAESLVGPSLDRIASRVYIAGRLVNEPNSMIAWIRDPQHLRSPTAMPTLGVGEQDGRDIAAYLYTLK
jgi:cytochrome c1